MKKTPLIFGSYWQATSPLHAMDTRTKMVATLALIVMCFCATNFASLGLMCAFTVALYALARIPLSTALRSAAPLLIIAALTFLFNLFFVHTGDTLASWWIFTITTGSLYAACFYGLRLSVLVFVACLLTLCTPILKITSATESMLAPLAKIGAPVHELATMTGIALRFLPLFADEFDTVRQAHLARGAVMSFNPFKGGLHTLKTLTVPLFVSAFRHAETLSQAMDARCYHGSRAMRTRERYRFGTNEMLTFGVILMVFGAALALNGITIL